MGATKPDFTGFATKAGLKCSDGRTIGKDAFAHMDGKKVPLVWMHRHDEPENVLGYGILHAVDGDIRVDGYLNETDRGLHTKAIISHGDVEALSIFANQLRERSKEVLHGVIREVSIVLAGANPGALIDNIAVRHSDGEIETYDDEALIFNGLPLIHAGADAEDEDAESEDEAQEVEHADGDKTLKDILDSMTEEQQTAVAAIVGEAISAARGESAQHSDDQSEDETSDDSNTDNDDEGEITHSDQEGTDMTRNVFETQGDTSSTNRVEHQLTRDKFRELVGSAIERKQSLKHVFEDYALAHGINDIELLFPDAKNATTTPDWDKRRTEWVAGVLNGTRHVPYSRIKTMQADITQEEARAKGYIKGAFKKEEFFGLTKRVTTPTTIYKKQKLDRDDMIDITDFDVVTWLKGEMRLMLEEELARAILVGDGREVDDEDKIKDPMGASEGAGIRSIANDHEMYAVTVRVNLDDADSSYEEIVDQLALSMEYYKGTGTPTFYTTRRTLARMLQTKDKMGRKLWRNAGELATEMGVDSVVAVEVMEGQGDLVGIVVNLSDYSVGTDRGGEINTFDDFDIDYNQYKYLIETRGSGALTKLKSALVVRKVNGALALVTPEEPAFDGSDILVPNTTGVVYKNGATVVTNTTVSVPNGETVVITAEPAAGKYFATSEDDTWSFTNPA